MRCAPAKQKLSSPLPCFFLLTPPYGFSEAMIITVVYSAFQIGELHIQNNNTCRDVPWNVPTMVDSNENCCNQT